MYRCRFFYWRDGGIQKFQFCSDVLSSTFAVMSRSAIGITDEFGKSDFLQPVINSLNHCETVKSPVASFLAGTCDFLFLTKHLRNLPFFPRTGLRVKVEVESLKKKRKFA